MHILYIAKAAEVWVGSQQPIKPMNCWLLRLGNCGKKLPRLVISFSIPGQKSFILQQGKDLLGADLPGHSTTLALMNDVLAQIKMLLISMLWHVQSAIHAAVALAVMLSHSLWPNIAWSSALHNIFINRSIVHVLAPGQTFSDRCRPA